MRKFLVLTATWLALCGSVVVAQQILPGFPPGTFSNKAALDPAPGGGCSQATTFLARTSGVSGGDQTAMTTLICGLVTDGVITGTLASSSFCGSLLDRFYVFAITNSTTALLDICGNTGLTANGSLTFTADAGYTPTTEGSTSQFLDTAVNSNALTNYAQNSAHLSAWTNLTSHGTNGASAMGLLDNAASGMLTQIDPQYTDNNAYMRINDGASASGGASVANAQGFYVAARSGGSAQKGYRATGGTVTDLGISSVSSLAPVAAHIYILCLDQTTGGCQGATNNQVMEASIGANLSLTQVTNLYTRLRTYLTTVAGISY